jgi:excisionase family DNA binding protein
MELDGMRTEQREVENRRPEGRALLLRATEVADLLGVSRAKAYELMASETIPTLRIGRSVRVPRAALEAWIESNTRQGIER